MIGIRSIFLSTLLIGDEENDLYSDLYNTKHQLKHITSYILACVHMNTVTHIATYVPVAINK